MAKVTISNYSTFESRAKAVEASNRVRKERVSVFDTIKNGSIGAENILFNLDKYPCMQRVRVKRFLKAFKGISDAKADKIMAELKIAENRRLQGLGTRQKTNLVLAIERYQW